MKEFLLFFFWPLFIQYFDISAQSTQNPNVTIESIKIDDLSVVTRKCFRTHLIFVINLNSTSKICRLKVEDND